MRCAHSEAKCQLTLYSYGLQGQSTPSARYHVDVRNLRDPQGNKDLRLNHKDGRDEPIQDWIQEDPRIADLVGILNILAFEHLTGPNKDSWFAIALYDHQGKWIAPAVVEIAANAIAENGFHVATRHMDLSGGAL